MSYTPMFREMKDKFNDVKTVLKGEFTKFSLTPTNPGFELEFEKGAGNSHTVLFIPKPSNVTLRTYKTMVKKLNFLMEAYPLTVTDFRKVCEAVLAKCAITHAMWMDLSADFEKLIAGADGAAKALKGRMTLPNLTSLKLILTVRKSLCMVLHAKLFG